MSALRLRTDVAVLHRGWTRAEKNIAALCRRWARAALAAGLVDLPARNGLKKAPSYELSIALAGDARVRGLNRAYRGKNKPTNVLSFPAFAAEMPPLPGPLALGDVIAAFQTTRREAAAEHKSIRAHAAHLVVHGVLHLLGYDHMVERDARRMERLERRILKGLGFADPYAGTAPDSRARHR